MHTTTEGGPPPAPVGDLYHAAVDAKPVDFDWTADETRGAWDTVPIDAGGWSLRECANWLKGRGRLFPVGSPDELDDDEIAALLAEHGVAYDVADPSPDYLSARVVRAVLDGELPDDAVAIDDWRRAVEDATTECPDEITPMMSYYYPLPGYDGDPGRDQAKLLIHAGAVCLVRVGDGHALALTGGGMDLSWDVVGAYVLLGYLPPLHFAGDLPRLAGMRMTPARRHVLEACVASAEATRGRAERALADLADLEKSIDP